MPSNSTNYKSLDDVHTEKLAVTPYWKLVSQISVWFLLAGFLILPTTFDKDADLRFADGVIVIVVVTILAAGYSLTILLWVAVPSILFRLEYILIPAASCAAFGFFACVWALVSSPRYDIKMIACPITIVLTVLSFTVYGAMAIWTRRRIKKIGLQQAGGSWPANVAWQETGAWQDNNSAYHNPHDSASYLIQPQQSPYNPEIASMHSAHNVPAQPVVTEEDLVNQQMAGLLTKHHPAASPEASRTTFRLEWPPGGDDEEDDRSKRNRSRTLSGSAMLSPEDARRSRRHSEATRMGRIGEAVESWKDGREAKKEQRQKEERRRSREERRREIELGNLTTYE